MCRIFLVQILILSSFLSAYSEDTSEDSDESRSPETSSHEHDVNNAVNNDDDDDDGKAQGVSPKGMSGYEKVIKLETRRVNTDNEGKEPEANAPEPEVENPKSTASGNSTKKPHENAPNETVTTFYPYRYTAAILRKGSYYAAGALITQKLILTAAGPFFTMQSSIRLFKVRLGSLHNKQGGQLMPLKSIQIHPSFDPKKPEFDVALVEMGYKVDISDSVKPTDISSSNEKVVVAKFLVSYWPRLIVNGLPLPSSAEERIKFNYLRVSLQSYLPRDTCLWVYKAAEVALDESSMCLTPLVTHHSVCTPDVGAPVVAEDGLWGVTSGYVASNCKKTPSPTLFTRLSTPAVKSWIAEIKKNSRF
ncbi:trypsin [Plutella xylostella]|uniref:trypsin n=1 Tax=Plutella xylostella TaxID=51655 RepID=UPI0020324BDC|nr:trypsin [Plutella xylostella]